jgi:hypothetical protein
MKKPLPITPQIIAPVKPTLGKLHMATRKAIRNMKLEKIRQMKQAFSAEMLKNNPSQESMKQATAVDTNSLTSPIDAEDIKYSDDGTLKKSSLPKYLKEDYDAAEQIRRAELQKQLDDLLLQADTFTTEDWLMVDALNKKIANPFRGIFKEDKAA